MASTALARGARAIEQSAGRETVVRAAARVFMEKGYAATTMDDIAMVIGATKGWVYHYYRSKVALFTDVHELALLTISQRVARVFEADLPPAQKFHDMCVEHLRTMIDEFALCRVGAVHGLENYLAENATAQQARMVRKIVRLRDDFEGMFVQAIEAGAIAGVFKKSSPRLLAKAALGTLNWFGVWFDPKRKTTDSELAEIAQTLAACATDGLRVGAES